jgi:hypothetical protein
MNNGAVELTGGGKSAAGMAVSRGFAPFHGVT